MAMVILGIVLGGLHFIGKWDRPLSLNGRKYLGVLTAALLQGSVILYLTAQESLSECRLWLSIIGGCLLLACVTDLKICHVYNFTWWIALTAAAILLWSSLYGQEMVIAKETMQSLLFFLLLQFVLFGRMYGRADCYAFCMCAIVEAARGMRAAGFLFHMLLSYAFLVLVQGVRGNISKKGNLKNPVPFLPYITVSFWLVLAFGQT